MTRRFIKELQPGERIEDEVFLIQSKDLRTTNQGGLYIHAVLVDRTGQLVARHWQATEDLFHLMGEHNFMRLKGRTENYKGNLQFIIEGMQPAEAGTFEIADFLPTTDQDVDRMWSRLVEILQGVRDPHLSALVREFLDDKALMAGFRRAPAAIAMHHAYLGGLLEHTLHLLEVALKVIPLYPKLNLDLVLTGLFLHDIGKSKELVYDTMIAYSDRGQLVGHISLAVVWVQEKARAVAVKTGRAFPEDLLSVVQHIILSHHGQYEFGSPKLPALPEAIAIHYLDNLDAKVNLYLGEIEKDPSPQAHWTNYNRSLATKLFKQDVARAGNRNAND